MSPPKSREDALTRRLRNIQKTATRSQCQSVLTTAQVLLLPGCRPCGRCGCGVNDMNLGGWNGGGPMTGLVFCYRCADGAFPVNHFCANPRRTDSGDGPRRTE